MCGRFLFRRVAKKGKPPKKGLFVFLGLVSNGNLLECSHQSWDYEPFTHRYSQTTFFCFRDSLICLVSINSFLSFSGNYLCRFEFHYLFVLLKILFICWVGFSLIFYGWIRTSDVSKKEWIFPFLGWWDVLKGNGPFICFCADLNLLLSLMFLFLESISSCVVFESLMMDRLKHLNSKKSTSFIFLVGIVW